MLVCILEYLSDHDILQRVARVNRHMYRLAHDNCLWKRRMHRYYPATAYAQASHVTQLHVTHANERRRDLCVLCLACVFVCGVCLSCFTLSAFGPQDLSVNWLARYVSEARAVRTPLDPVNRLSFPVRLTCSGLKSRKR